MSVFTKVSQTQLVEFLAAYDVGQLVGFQGIGEGVENTNYFVDTSDGRWVLTLFERLNYADLPFFLGLMEHLATAGFPGAAPLQGRDSHALRTLNGKPAALVRRLSGQWDLFADEAQCGQVGTVLAQLHLSAASYRGHCENSRGTAWRQATALALRDKVDAGARQFIDEELAAQAALDLSSLSQGIIHADLFKDNVLFVNRQLSGVIDFYYACNDALVYDLAITLNDWCFDAHGQLQPEHAQAMLAAYRQARKPTDAERAAWPLVLRAAAFRFYLSRLHDWVHPRSGDVVHVKDPAQYRRILESLRGGAMPAL